MKHVQKILMADFIIGIVVSLAVVVLGESGMADFTQMNLGEESEFYLLYAMELATVCLIPLALRLFKFKRVARQLQEQGDQAHIKWGLYRMDMLSIPMFLNTVLYYVYQHASFGYLAIILLICHAFVYPSMKRCQAERNDQSYNH